MTCVSFVSGVFCVCVLCVCVHVLCDGGHELCGVFGEPCVSALLVVFSMFAVFGAPNWGLLFLLSLMCILCLVYPVCLPVSGLPVLLCVFCVYHVRCASCI